MIARRGMTLPEILVVILIAFGFVVFMASAGAGCGARRTANQMKNSSRLRAIHQSSVIYANSNGSYLPGMNSSGTILDSTDKAFSSLAGGDTGTPGLGGGAFNTRLYILLNNNYIAGDLVINPLDKPTKKWINPLALPIVPTSTNPGQFSYSLLNIADSSTGGSAAGKQSPGRVGEWRDNANSAAVLISDRNLASSTVSPRSIWATSAGAITDWKGNVVWGDNHAEFLVNSTGLKTKYLETENSADSLFFDGVAADSPGEHKNNAFFNWVSANY